MDTSVTSLRHVLGVIFNATGFESPKSPQYSTKFCMRKKGVLRAMNHQKVPNIPPKYAILFVEYFGQPITKKSVQYHFVTVTFYDIFRTFLWLLGQCIWGIGAIEKWLWTRVRNWSKDLFLGLGKGRWFTTNKLITYKLTVNNTNGLYPNWLPTIWQPSN